MSRAPCFAFDTRDDRKEMHQLLCKLSPAKRLAFLAWCCTKAAVPNSVIRPCVGRAMPERAALAMKDDSADEKLSLEIYLDVWNLSLQYQLDLVEATAELVRRVRRVRRV